RLLEIIMAPDNWSTKLSDANQQLFLSTLYLHLINGGYYQQMVHLLVTRIPEVYESTEAPPTPLAESLLNLLMKPLTFACAVNDSTLLSCVIEELCQDVFGGAAHSQICNFVIPCLASSSKYKLPMDRIVAVLGCRSLKFLDSCPAPSLLYSLLMLVHSSAGLMHQGSNTDSTSDDSDIGNTSSDEFNDANTLCNYLQAISDLLGGTTSYLISDVTEGDSEDEDDD
ncbi:hypothetical protein OTU49_006740, partial [Cherax quadricarinatus]